MARKLMKPASEVAKQSKMWGSHRKPWLPPASLTEEWLKELECIPRITLSRAVIVMAFGKDSPPTDKVEWAARRQQACGALCGAASANKVTLYGCTVINGDNSDQIPDRYFDTPRCMDEDSNTLTTDLDLATVKRSNPNRAKRYFQIFLGDRGGKHQKWFNVRVETKSLSSWLRNILSNRGKRRDAESMCEEWLLEEMRKSPEQRPKPKEEFMKAALTRFPGLSKRGFRDRAWPVAVKKSGATPWTKAGAPRK